jgi:hypothetical protein
VWGGVWMRREQGPVRGKVPVDKDVFVLSSMCLYRELSQLLVASDIIQRRPRISTGRISV